jgi:acyl-coenzyme A synthetase/AMP-(fatty) acid ligase
MTEFFDLFEKESLYSQEFVKENYRRGYWSRMGDGDYLDWHAEEHGNRIALIDDRQEYTWAELREQANKVAAGLQNRGIEKGDRICYQVPDRAEWLIARLGILSAGAIAVNMIPRFREQEISHLLNKTNAKAYIGPASYKDDDHIEIVRELEPDLDSLEHIFAVDGQTDGTVTAFDDLLETNISGFSPERVDPDYPVTLATTSGTTGMPKPHYMQQNTRLTMAEEVLERYSVTEYDDIMVLAPIQQGTGELWAYHIPLVSGATIRLTQMSTPEDQWEAIDDHEPSFICAIPTQMTKMMNATGADDYSLSFVRVLVNGGAPLPEETARYFESKGTVSGNFYGASDGGLPTAVCPMDSEEERFQSVGKPLRSMSLKIIDGNGEEVELGTVGEVIYRGGNQTLGYYKDRERTEQTFDIGGTWEGWFHSGDAGVLDEHGNLEIVGRMDDMILRGGQNIYPAEVEDALIRHPDVEEIAIVPMPDPEYGERACAYVVTSNDDLTLDDLVSFLDDEGFAKFMWPERLERVDDLPRSPGGKIDKAELKSDIEQKVSEEGR